MHHIVPLEHAHLIPDFNPGEIVSIEIVQGHSSWQPDRPRPITIEVFDSYIRGTGPFIGRGEIGVGSVSAPAPEIVVPLAAESETIKSGEKP